INPRLFGNRWPPQTTCAGCAAGSSGDFLPPSPPAEKATAGPMEYRLLVVSLRLDARELHHLAPLLGFVSDDLCEVGARARQRLAEVSQTDLHLGVGEGRVDLLVELLDDLGWRVPGNADAIPRCRLVARHEFSHSWDTR